MNIKKKISFFALFLISSFFIVGEVKGYYCSKNGTICVDSSGTSVGSRANLTPERLSTLEEDWVHSYRITLVKQDGTKVAGPKNVYFDNNFQNTNYHYNTYKFSDSFNVDKPANGKISSLYVSHSESSDKEYFEYIKNQITNYIKGTNTTFVKNLGFAQTINNYIEKNEYLFAIVEKNYEIAFSSTPNESATPISYSKMCETDVYKQRYKDVGGDVAYACDNPRGEYVNSPTTPAFYEVYIDRTINYYVGTGSEIARLIEYVSKRNFVPKTNYFASDVWNLKFSGSLKLFGKGLMVDSDGLKLNFTPLKQIAPSCSGDDLTCIYNTSYGYAYGLIRVKAASGCNSKADADSMGLDWNASNSTCCAAGTKYNSKTGKCETPAICDATNYKSLGRDYNANYTNPKDNTHCCDVGKKYNPKRNDCETVESECNGSNYYSLKRSFNTTLGVCCLPGQNLKDGKPQMVGSCFTKDSTPTNYDYNYYCYTQSNMCSKNNVNSTINSYVTTVKNGPTSMYKKGPTQSNLTDNQSGECILNNSAYYVGMVNGTKIYCSDSLETSLSGMISNLSVKSGTFMPVSSPTITVKHNCYFTLASNSVKEQYTQKIKDIYSKFTSPSINLNFMNKDYTFNGSGSSVDTGTLSTQSQKTVYGNEYYTYSFTTTYTPGYSSTLLNKYVDKKTATGSGDSFGPINGMAYNQMSKNINISIPTDASGTYSAKYTLGSNSYSNPAINHILSNSTTTLTNQYDTKKTVECGGTCKIEYSSVLLNCESTGSLIKKIFNDGYGSDLRISNTKDSCKFTMQFPVGSKAECTRAKGNLATLKATYTKDSCTEKVSFNTKVTGANNSCSNNVTVENIDIKEDLVFRPISLSNPFPGQNGNGRSMGSPWTDDLKKTYITNRSDVYSKKPLYSITLTPSTIKQIRGYNQKNSYDDFNLTCSNGEACYSMFLRSSEYSKIINTNKSNCYNANDRSVNAFNTCADYSKRK